MGGSFSAGVRELDCRLSALGADEVVYFGPSSGLRLVPETGAPRGYATIGAHRGGLGYY